MKTNIKLQIIFLSICAIIGCSDNEGSNPTSPNNEQTSTTITNSCVEGTVTEISGSTYVCNNNSFIPIQLQTSSEASGILHSSSSAEESIPSVHNYCQYIGEWKYDANGNFIMCYDNQWMTSEEVNRLQQSSTSSIGQSSSSSAYSIVVTTKSSSSLAVNYDGYSGTLKDSRDGNVYKTVGIGPNIWMAENLNYKTDSSWCYDNIPEKCENRGRLYTWPAAMNLPPSYIDSTVKITGTYQGICPQGWHVPTSEEYANMVKYVIKPEAVYDDVRAGEIFCSTNDWTTSTKGVDSLGYNVLPTGYRNDTAAFVGETTIATFWTTKDGGYYYMTYPGYYLIGHPIGTKPMKYYARSLRCVKDEN